MRSVGDPVNLAGSGNGHDAVTTGRRNPDTTRLSSASQSVMMKSMRGAFGPVNSATTWSADSDVVSEFRLNRSRTSSIGASAGSEPAE